MKLHANFIISTHCMPYCYVKNNVDFTERILFSVIPLIKEAKIYLAQFVEAFFHVIYDL